MNIYQGYSYHSLISFIYLKKYIKNFSIFLNIPNEIIYYISEFSLLLEKPHPANKCRCSIIDCKIEWGNLLDLSKLNINQEIIHCKHIYVYSYDPEMIIHSTCHHIYLKKDGKKKCTTCNNVPFDKILKFKQKFYSNTSDIVI